jgi:hypothetical protein
MAMGDTSPPSSPHPELVKRSLFVSGLRNSIKQAEVTDVSSSAPNPTDLIIQNSFPTDPQKLSNFERKLHETSHNSSSRPRAQTTIVASKKSDFQTAAKPTSSHRATARGSFLKSGKKVEEKRELTPLIRPISPRKPTGTPRSLALTSPKRSPTGSDDQGDEDSAGDEDPSSPRDENATYALFSIVEAR